MMKKWCALLLVFAMTLALTACGQKDPEKDAATVVAEVGDTKITKGEALKVYDFVLKQIVAMYLSYGYSASAEDAEIVSSAKATTLGLMAEGLALEKQLDAFGIGLTETDLTDIQAEAEVRYNEMIDMFVSTYGETTETAKAEADAQGYTMDAIYFFARRDIVDAKLREVALTDVTVTDEEIQAEYDELVASQSETYETTPSQYGSDVLNGSTVYVRPAGYRYVKNLVVGLPDDISEQVSGKRNEEYTVMYELYSLQSQLYSQTDMDEATEKTINDQIATAQENYERLEEEAQALISQGREQVRSKAEEILALCKAPDADFDALMAEYSVDKPTNEVILAHGYPVSADSSNYVPTFTEGAMAMANIGDISDLIESDYGFHILLYTGNVEPGIVPLSEIRDAISESVLTTKQDEAYTAKTTEWIEAANIKTYADKL